MKKQWTLMGLLIVVALSLTLFGACAKKQAVVMDKPVADQRVATTQPSSEAPTPKPAPATTAKPAPAVQQEIQIIYFDFDRSSIRPDAREALRANADIFRQSPNTRIVIEGHCDERGTSEYNMALGERRAREAKDYLANLGIDTRRMETVSYGEERPLDPRSNEEAWAKNRRVQFRLVQ